MPHNRFDWASRIKTVGREYSATRIALDWLLEASPDEIHELAAAREWDDLAVASIYDADRHLDATYLIRMFSVFDRAVHSFWRLLPGNDERSVEGDARIDEVGVGRVMLQDLIEGAQDVRVLRNRLVHGRIEEHYSSMAFADAREHLLSYLARLPEKWG